MKSLVGVDSPYRCQSDFFLRNFIISCPCLIPPMSSHVIQINKLLMTLSKSAWSPPHSTSTLCLTHSTLATLAILLFFDPSAALYQDHHPCCSLCLNTLPSDLSMAESFASLRSLLKAASSGSSPLTVPPKTEWLSATLSFTLLQFLHRTYCLGCYITDLLIYLLIVCPTSEYAPRQESLISMSWGQEMWPSTE